MILSVESQGKETRRHGYQLPQEMQFLPCCFA
jgi:hypothetical protein